MLDTCKNSTDLSTIQVQKNDNKISSTANGSKFATTKTEQATENQE